MEDNTRWYYTLSTIAQALATVLALGGTFIVFKLERIRVKIDALRNKAEEILRAFQGGSAPFFENIPDEELLSNLKNELKKIKLDEVNWGNIGKTRNLLIDFYRNSELNKKMDDYYEIKDNKVINFLKNVEKRLEDDVNRKKHALKELKFSLFCLTFTIISSIALLPFHSLLRSVDFKLLVIVVDLTVLSIYSQGRIIWSLAKD